MLQDLLTEEKSTCQDISYLILGLNNFSRTMLKGKSPLVQKLPYLIEFTGDSLLRWRYACAYLARKISDLTPAGEVECLVTQGVEFFTTVQCPIREGLAVSRKNTCVSADALCSYYVLQRNRETLHADGESSKD